MSTLHLHQTTTATPEQFLAALTDTDIDEEVTRDGKNLKGRIIGFGLGTAIGKHTFEKA